MPRLVAFLRAINVGGHVVTMAELRTHFEALRFTNVETFIASGNVVFSSSSNDLSALEQKIEARLQKSLGYEVKTFVRTLDEVAAVARHKPFSDARMKSARTLCIGFLAEPFDRAAVEALMAMRTDIDDFHVHGREVYWSCLKGQSDSKFSNMAFERALKTRTTFRGVNTIVKLAAKYASVPGAARSRKGQVP